MQTQSSSTAPSRHGTKIAKSSYPTPRAKAWRNAMVAAINAGLEQGIFGLKPGENFWPNAKNGYPDDVKPGGAIFRFTFEGDVPAIVWVGDAGHDELSVHVALWPTADAEKWVVCWNAGRTAGGVFATGWLERQRTPYLQETPNLITGKREGLAAAAEAEVEPVRAAYRDHGRMIF